jgi:hypothetical protein
LQIVRELEAMKLRSDEQLASLRELRSLVASRIGESDRHPRSD